MPTYRITAPDGRKLKITGENFPSEQELDEIFAGLDDNTAPETENVSGVNFNQTAINDNISKNDLFNEPVEQANNQENFNPGVYKAADLVADKGMDNHALDKQNTILDRMMKFGNDTEIFFREGTKGFVRGGLEMIKGSGTLLQMYGDNLYDGSDISGLDFEEQQKIKQGNFTAKSYQYVGGLLKKFADAGLSHKLLELDKEINRGTFLENPSVTRAASIVGGALPSLMVPAGIYKTTGSAVLRYLFAAGVDSADVYEEAKEAGASQAKANALFATSVAGTAAIDKVLKPLEKILDGQVNSTAKRIVKAFMDGGREGVGETFQQVWQNGVKKYGYNPMQDLLEGTVESFIGGVGSGGMLSFATSASQARYENAKENLKAQGMTEEQLAATEEIIAQEISNQREAVNPIIQENIEKSTASFDKWLNEHSDLESRKAVRESLDQVYGMVYDNLLGKMDKVQARNNAKLMQGIALAGAKMTGLTPMEYITQRAPEVRSFMEDSIQAKQELAASLDKIRNPWKIKKVKDERQSLLQFLKSQGGLKDTGGELKAMDTGKSVIGLINNQNGLSLDDAAMMAWERGYFEGKAERPEINDLLDAVADELAGNKHYNEEFSGNEEAAYLADLTEEIHRAGKSTMDSVDDIYDALYKNRKSEVTQDVDAEDLNFNQSPKPQIEIRGDELGEYKDLADLRSKAIGYYRNNLLNEVIDRPEVGKIHFSLKGQKEYKRYSGNPDKLKAVVAIKDIIQNGAYDGYELSHKPRKDGIVGFHKFSAKVEIGGKAHDADVLVGQDRNGNMFYDLFMDYNHGEASNKKLRGVAGDQSQLARSKVEDSTYNQSISPDNDNFNIKLVDKAANNRGQIKFLDDGRAIISLLENADASTFVHEIGHFWLNEVNELAGVSEEAAKMVAEIDNWLGAAGDGTYSKAQQEQFARGLEQYLREGKAPSHYLKTVFKRFMEWLREIYRTADELEVKLSDEVRGVYAAMYGGRDLDFFMKNDIPVEDIVKSNIEQHKRRITDYQEAVTRGIERMQKKKSLKERVVKGTLDSLQDAREWMQDAFMVSEDVLGKYSKELVLKNRRLEIAKMSNIRDYNARILPFLEKWQQMSDADKFRLDMALKNHVTLDIDALVAQYHMENEWYQVRQVLDDIHNDMLDVGIDVKYMQDYFPRGVKDTDGLLDEIEKRVQADPDAKYSMIERTLEEKFRNGRQYSEADVVQLVNALMRGYGGGITLSNIGNVKARTLELIDEELNEYYRSSPDALINYIAGSVEMIENKRYFGKESADIQLIRNRIRNRATKIKDFTEMEAKEVKIREIKRLNYEIGGVEAKIRNTFDAERKKELEERKKKLEERVDFFGKRRSEYVKNITLDRMRQELEQVQEELNSKVDDTVEGSIGRLILKMIGQGKIKARDERRIREYLTAKFTPARMNKFVQGMHNLGYLSTIGKFSSAITQLGDIALSAYQNGIINSAQALGQAVRGKSEISLEMVGIDNKTIAEFAEDTGFLAKTLDKVLGYTGFTKIDNLGKRVVMNSALAKLRKDVKAEDPEILKYLQDMFGDGAAQVRSDLLTGRITPEIMEMAVFKVMDLQPLTADQTPMFYMKGGSWRIAYALKTYMLRLLNVYKRDCVDKLFIEGRPVQATANFMKLAIYLGLANSGVDLLKDLLLGREISISDTLMENILGLSLFKKYQVESFKRDGFEAFFNIMPPTVQMAGDVINDIFNSNKDVGNRKSWRYLPFIGDFYYYWFGGGNEKNKAYERKKAGRRAAETRKKNKRREG